MLTILENFQWIDKYYDEDYIQTTLDKVYKFIEEFSNVILNNI